MAQTELFKRYIWLVSLLYKEEMGLSREEINCRWCRSSLNTDGEQEIPERTFHRHKEAVKELFDIDILCDRHGDKRYYIANLEDLKHDKSKQWLLSSFAMGNLFTEYRDLRDRILFEPKPSGDQYLPAAVEAMREGKVLEISYQSFRMESPALHDVEPYCLKFYQQRWYLLGRRPERNVMRVFALDRIKGMKITGTSFVVSKSFDAEKYFENTVGIVVEDNVSAQTVTFKTSSRILGSIRSLPLHPTQREYETRDDGGEFSIFVQPNKDLAREFLKHGDDLTVIRPKWFRDKIKGIIESMSDNYNDEESHEKKERGAKPVVKVPRVLTESDLIRLCREYRDSIGKRRTDASIPKIRIRYVIDRDRFGYVDFGDFFFIENGDLYVWTRDEEFAEDHNQDIVETYFDDECKGRGYCHRVLFAGVRTDYQDSNGEDIYTGDVLDLKGFFGDGTYALGTLGENSGDWEATYAFVLDNHCIRPEECESMTRVGTVFYQLDWNAEPQSIPELCHAFQPWHDDGLSDADRRTLARYTPNFDQELWKYHACEILGIEFNWRK